MIRMKKRIYIAPVAQEIEVGECDVICSSIPFADEETNTGGRVQRNERNNWGNLWKQQDICG